MSETIPENVVRNIIADILFSRSNDIDLNADELIEEDKKETGVVSQYSLEVGWNACGTRVLSDDIREGIIPLEEAVEALTSLERKEAKRQCQEYLKEKQKSEKER